MQDTPELKKDNLVIIRELLHWQTSPYSWWALTVQGSIKNKTVFTLGLDGFWLLLTIFWRLDGPVKIIIIKNIFHNNYLFRVSVLWGKRGVGEWVVQRKNARHLYLWTLPQNTNNKQLAYFNTTLIIIEKGPLGLSYVGHMRRRRTRLSVVNQPSWEKIKCQQFELTIYYF